MTLPATANKRYSNDALATGLHEGGKIVFQPGGPGFVHPDGSLETKSAWWRLRPGSLTISGRRLDGAAAALRSDVAAEGYPNTGFVPASLIFPTPGCWEITGHLGGAQLTFVTLVEKIADGPCGKTAMDPNEVGGSFEASTWTEERTEKLGHTTLTYATGTRSYVGGIEGTGALELFIVRRPGNPPAFLGYEHIEGAVKGSSGSFDVRHSGTIEGDIARSAWVVLPASGRGALADLGGQGTYVTGTDRRACYSLWYSGL